MFMWGNKVEGAKKTHTLYSPTQATQTLGQDAQGEVALHVYLLTHF